MLSWDGSDVNFGGDPSPNTVHATLARGGVTCSGRIGPIAWVSLWETRTPEEFEISRRTREPSSSRFGAQHRGGGVVDPDPEIPMQMRAWSKLMVDPPPPLPEGCRPRVISERLLEPLELAVLPDGRMLGEEFDLSYVPSALTYGLLAELGEHPSGPPAILAVSGRSDPPSARVASLVDMDETSRSQRQLRNAYRRNESPARPAAAPSLRGPRGRNRELDVPAAPRAEGFIDGRAGRSTTWRIAGRSGRSPSSTSRRTR